MGELGATGQFIFSILKSDMVVRLALAQKNLENIERAARAIATTVSTGNKTILVGNECFEPMFRLVYYNFMSPILKKRQPFPATILSGSVALEQQINAMAKPGDLIATCLFDSGATKNKEFFSYLRGKRCRVLGILTGEIDSEITDDDGVIFRYPTSSVVEAVDAQIFLFNIILKTVETFFTID